MEASGNPFTGQLPFLMITAPLLALPIATFLLWLYRRAVVAAMQRASGASAGSTSEPAGAGASPPASTPAVLDVTVVDADALARLTGPAATLYRDVSRGPWRAAAVYAIAGVAYGMAMATAALLASGIGFLVVRFAMLSIIYAWPVVLAVAVMAAPDRRGRLRIAGAYFGLLFVVTAVALASSTEFTVGQAVGLFLIENLPASVLLLAFWIRRVRAVGPLVLGFLAVALMGSLVVLTVAGGSDDFLWNLTAIGQALGFGAVSLLAGILIVGFALFGIPGWLFLQAIGRAYRRRRLSDQSLALDAMWLLFAMAHAVLLASEGPIWILSGVVAFAVYRVVVAAGQRRLRSRARDVPVKRLLLLRVFALGRRSEALFDALTVRWRHVGSVQLIAGPDLATTTVEPHEFLAFLSGKLESLFIGDAVALDRRLGDLDLQPDPDGRFRVNEFFCYGDTWQTVLAHLVQESEAVLMDLRGFGPENEGCRAELQALAESVPLEAVTLVVDETTDSAYLETELRSLLAQASSESPNRPGPAPLRKFRLARTDAATLSGLAACLCESAAGVSRSAMRESHS